MKIARSQLFKSFALAALQQRQEWELPPASELNCNRMKVQNYATRNEELHGAGD
jgi:hypothetical protein